MLVASEQPLLREGMSRLVRRRVTFDLVAELDDGAAAFGAIVRLRPDVAILEPAMHGLDAGRLLNMIGRDQLPTRIVLISGDPGQATSYDALAVGALAFLSTRATGDEIDRAIDRAARGEATIHPDAHTVIARRIRLRELVDRPVLTPRELEIVRLAADGMSASGKAAERLFIATTTVRTHWAHIFGKLDVTDRAGAVAAAIRLGLLD